TGSTASRLICGDLPCHRALEKRLATIVGYPDAVLFPSGFQLNVGIPACLIQPDHQVFSDQLNHASIIDGLRLARVKSTILPHRSAPPLPTPEALSWWFSESAFSMDGDHVDPDRMQRHLSAGGLAYLDEAHTFGLFPGQLTFSAAHNLHPTVLVGTFGKALACAGAFVASSKLVCQWIRTHARGMVFSTGTSPLVVRAIDQALDIVLGPEGESRRSKLQENLDHLTSELQIRPRQTPIIPLFVGTNQKALEVSGELLARGLHVQAIRPPTVPKGASRLRLTMSAGHDAKQIDVLASSLTQVFAKHGLDLLTEVPGTP
ncbi:MAG: aminotransferase class I/II-fold pyridoxal phosphate-dependent enzyme, partial [Nannocystaceae bacterium]